MPNAPSRSEVEQLHRQMMQASTDVSEVQRRLHDAQKKDLINKDLREWYDAAEAIHRAVEMAEDDLLQHGTPWPLIERIYDRLDDIEDKSRSFDVSFDLDAVVAHWQALGVEFSRLSGPSALELARLLARRREKIDEVTEELSQAMRLGGMLPEQHRRVLALQDELELARERYERLRQKYLEAEADYQAAERQRQLEALALEHQRRGVPPPDFGTLIQTARRTGPIVVRLPDPAVPRRPPRPEPGRPPHRVAKDKFAERIEPWKPGHKLPGKPLAPPPPKPAQVVKPPSPPVKPPEKLKVVEEKPRHLEHRKHDPYKHEEPKKRAELKHLEHKHVEHQKHIELKHVEFKHLERRHVERPHLERKHIEIRHLEHKHVEQKHHELKHLEHKHVEQKHHEQKHAEHKHIEHRHQQQKHAEHKQIEKKYAAIKHLTPKHIEQKREEHKHVEQRHEQQKRVEHKHVEHKHEQQKRVEHRHVEHKHEQEKRVEHKHVEHEHHERKKQQEHRWREEKKHEEKHARKPEDHWKPEPKRPEHEKPHPWKPEHRVTPLVKPKPIVVKPGSKPAKIAPPQHPAVRHHVAHRPGPPRVALERVDKVNGYPPGTDGIGRGGASASIYFRAENLPESLSIQGTTTLQLGCGVRLDVLPSMQLLAHATGGPVRGKIYLTLLSSGGQLGSVAPRSALDAARTAARAGGRVVASKLGIVGKHLHGAIADVLDDAAAKVFARAQPKGPHQHPHHPHHHHHHHHGAIEHHVARFDHALGSILMQARGGRDHTERLLGHLDRDHHGRDSVAGRLEQTLGHLATASHRTLTDPKSGEFRSHLARMDAILARIKGKRDALADGVDEIGDILARMHSLAAGKGTSDLRKLIDERKGALRHIAGEPEQKSHRRHKETGFTGQMVAAELTALRKMNPGLDRVLKGASQSHLAAELAKVQKSALSKLRPGKLPKGGFGSFGLTGSFQALGGAHLGGFGGGHRGGLAGLAGIGGALGKTLEKQVETANPVDVGKILAAFQKTPSGAPLQELARKAAEKARRRAKARPRAAHITPDGLLDVLKDHPKGKGFARHFAKGGELYSLVQAAQRGPGLPIGQTAQHYLASRGHSHVFNAVATFNGLIKQGHKPHRWGLGSIGHFVSSAVHSVSNTVSKATSTIADVAKGAVNTARSGISDFANRAVNFGKSAMNTVGSVVNRGVGAARSAARAVGRGVANVAHGVSNFAHRAYDGASHLAHDAYDFGSRALHSAGGFISSKAHGLWNAAKGAGKGVWGMIKQGAHGLANVAKSGFHAIQGAASWVGHKAGAAFDWARQKAGGAIDWAKHKAAVLGDKVHAGLEWIKKTGVVGALGTGLKKGISFVKKAAEFTPLGMAIKAGKWAAGGGLAKVWDKTKSVAGKAWSGIKTAGATFSKWAQSPVGQGVIGVLSLAATFIPGGLVVKTLVGAGIGAITAISEGKDWKGVLAGAAGGALTGALPFLKIGPLAKIGIGALQGGISAIASGGNLKDVLKGAAGGAVDSFDPGALKALGKLKGVSAAGKLLGGGKLSKAEKAFMEGSKFGKPLRALEKAMANPKARKMVGALERTGSKAVKGGIWVSGKAAKAQSVLDKVVGAGDKVHGVLSEVHDLAPGLAGIVGDNAVGHFISNVGDLAGKGDDKLSKALEYGHTASDQLSKYRGYLDKGLGYAGVKDPAKAYEKMMARKDLARGKKGGLEHVARLKLEDHKAKHPELHLAEATGKRTRGAHGAPKTTRRRPSLAAEPHEKGRLEKALAKGRKLIKKGEKVAQGVHGGLGKVHSIVEKGLGGAQKVQGGLEQASKLAKMGAGIFGEDTELGKYLNEIADKADHAHGYLEQGIGLAETFNAGVGKAYDLTGKIPGVHDESPLEKAEHLHGGKKKGKTEGHAGGKKSPHGETAHAAPKANETEEEKSRRLSHARNLIDTVSRMVQSFEGRYSKVQLEIHGHLGKGEASQASSKLMGLGSECDQINRYIAEAKTASKGHDGYTKEIKFYEEWHAKTKKKLQAAIADTKGLGGGTAISAPGITEATHPDIFANTRDIYAVRTKVTAFGEALHDHDAAEHVKKILEEAKKAKADLQKLKSKYRKDKAATRFLTAGGEQDRLIDEVIRKLEAALKGESPAKDRKKPAAKGKEKKDQPGGALKKVEGGLKALQQYKKKALKAGRKVDASLGKLEHALGKGIAIGKKVDGGLEKVAGLADQVAGMFGEDSAIGHFAHQVGEGAGKGHEKLHEALAMAGKGKRGLHKGHELFHKGLQLASGHHEKQVERVHGKKPAHAHVSEAELLKHGGGHKKSPHGELEQLARDGKHFVDDAGHVWKDGKRLVHDGKKFVHDARHAGKDAEHMFHDGQKMWKTGKKSVHDVEKGARHLKHGMHDASDLFGHLKEHDWKGALASGKALIKDGKVLLKDGKTIVGDAKKLFGEGKHIVAEGKHFWGEAKHLFGEGKHLLGEGKHLWGEVKHLAGEGAHLVKEGWDFVSGLFGGKKKKSPHDAEPGHEHKHRRKRKHPHHGKHPHERPAPHEEPGPAHHKGGGDQWSEADIAQVVQGALGWVTSFGKAVTSAIKDIHGLMEAGKTKEAGDRVQAVSVTSEQTRFEVTRAVSTSGKYPALAKQAKAASHHYLEIRKHFFDFVKGLHGLGGQTTELEGVDGKKYPDLLAISTDIDSLKVKVDALGDLKHADTPMQGPVKDLKKEASGLRSRLDKARNQYKKDPAATEVVEGLSAKLQQIEKALGAHTEKPNVAKGDKDLGLPPAGPKPKEPKKRRRRRKHPGHHGGDDDDHRLDPTHGGHRGDMGGQVGQEVDPAAADTWIGSGEGVKLFSEVFGAFLPAEGAVVHHHAGGGGKHHRGGITVDVSGKAHGEIDVAGVHAQGGAGGKLHGHLGAHGLDVAGKVGAGGSIDAFGLHAAGGLHAGGKAHIGPDGIHLEGGLDVGADIMGHHFGFKVGGKVDVSMKSIKKKLGKITGKATGFFKGLFDHLHGFADKIAGWAGFGAKMLGKGMHFAEMGMHGLSVIEKAASKVEGLAGKAEGFLGKMGLGKLAGFAGKIGGAAGWVGKESKLLHGGLKTADKWMGKGKKVAGKVEHGAEKAAGIFDKAEHGRFGALVSLFKASSHGDGIDGRLVPEKVRLRSQFDEPRRLDISTLSRMETFLGGTFSGVRIHTGPGAAQVTSRYAAEAVTVKDHIFFAPGRFNPGTAEGQRLLAHELTHVMQKGRPNLDVRTAESEALHSEHRFGNGPQMETLNLSQPQPDFKLADGEGLANSSGVYTAKRNRSRGHEAGGKDTLPDGEEFLEQVSTRVYDLLMEELEHSFESR